MANDKRATSSRALQQRQRPSTVTVFNTPLVAPGRVRPRLGVFRPGLVDDQAAHGQSRRARRVVRGRHGGDERGRRPVRAGPVLPGQHDADQVGTRLRAPLHRRLRPVRQRQDGAEVRASASTTASTMPIRSLSYADAGLRTENRNWFDCDLVQHRRHAPARASRCRPTTTASRRTTKSAPAPPANFGARADRNRPVDLSGSTTWSSPRVCSIR